jgi:outer membrane protein assembly factor BamB
MTEILLAVALGASPLSNFPREAGGRISQQAIGVTIGGAPAVVVTAGDHVLALRGDGSVVPGFPLSLGAGEVAAGAAAAADMDGDGKPEIAVVTTSGQLFLWSGGLVSGFPVQLPARVRAGVSFGDVDGDGRPELLVGDEKGRVHAFKRNGREVAGWPATVGAAVTSTISASRFAGGRSIAFGCEDGKVHVLDGNGRPRTGFPLTTKFTVTGAPAFADLDDDGETDLVVGSQDFSVYAVDARGKSLPGFPVRAGYRIYEGVAIADIDGDKRLDVVFASADGMVHAVSAKGDPLPGFPVKIGNRLFSGPAVGDLDRDGSPEIVAVTSDGAISAIASDGKLLPGFPHALQASDVGASPLLYEATADGTPAIFVGLPNGALHAVRASKVGTARAAIAWSGPGRDPAHGGRYGPNPPAYKELAIEPGAPRALDVVRANWRATWLDAGPNEPLPTPKIEWLRDGKHVAGLDGKKELPAGTVKRGERWRFVLTSAASFLFGSQSPTWESPEVRVLDTPPGAPVIAIDPAARVGAADVKAVIKTEAVDPDGDKLTYEIHWLLDGVDSGFQGEKFPGNLLRRGALLTARAIASDGELSGPPAVAHVRIGNTPPGPTRVSVDPATPARGQPVHARIEAPAVDPDGDPITYRYRWTVAGQPRNVPLGNADLDGALFRKHEAVEVEVRAFDGQLEGPPATATVTARNSPPTAPRVEIRPARPRRGDPLRVSVVEPSSDVDGDPITYRVEWRKNGAPFQGTTMEGREVPGDQVVRADVFQVTVTPHDGEAAGPSATATVTVGNTPPSPPRIVLEPARPKGGDTIKLVVTEPAHDVDGEKVTLQIAWTREGKPTGTGKETLPPEAFKKHERVRVLVTPQDGEGPGAPAAYEVMVEDTPPTAPVVAFSSERPTVTAPLKVLVKTPAKDADGDELKYQYRWILDGSPVAMTGDADRAKPAPFRPGPAAAMVQVEADRNKADFWTSLSEVPEKFLRKGQRWTVEVRAHDGELPGPIARASTVILNSPPPAPRLVFAPERPRRVDGISVHIEQPPDADGDVITYRYAWTRDGQRVETPSDQAQIPRGMPKKGQRWAVEVIANDGEADSPAVRHEAVIADTAPGPTAISLCEGPVPSGTVPQARVTVASIDPDGDPVTYRHDWTVNGKTIASAQGQARLTSPPLRKHDLVRVTVTPWDGDLAGPPTYGECEVENTAPTAPTIAIEPAEPTAAHGASVAIRKPSTDRDGDTVTYRFAWFRDGIPTSHDRAFVPGGVMRHGEVWSVRVTPFDGEDLGESVTASAVVKNTPPEAPSVVLVPASPGTGEAVVCDARAPEVDLDQEPITLRYRWYRNGQHVPVAEGLPALPSKLIRRGEKWRCEVWGSDGTAEGPAGSAELTVHNSPPSAPKIAIEPPTARRGDDLFCRVETPSVDPDDDPVSYSYSWTRNDRPMQPGPDAHGQARVEGSRISKGDRWRCTATPSDGAAAGPVATAERVVGNTPPGPAIARLEPATPRAGEPLRCELVVRSEDADGDQVRYRFAWQRNGAAQPFADLSQEVPPRLVKLGEKWRCTVTPTDGTDDGPSSSTEEIAAVAGTEEPAAEGPGPAPQKAPAKAPGRAPGRAPGGTSSGRPSR